MSCLPPVYGRAKVACAAYCCHAHQEPRLTKPKDVGLYGRKEKREKRLEASLGRWMTLLPDADTGQRSAPAGGSLPQHQLTAHDRQRPFPPPSGAGRRLCVIHVVSRKSGVGETGD